MSSKCKTKDSESIKKERHIITIEIKISKEKLQRRKTW